MWVWVCQEIGTVMYKISAFHFQSYLHNHIPTMNNRMSDAEMSDLLWNLEDLTVYSETKFLTVCTSKAAHLWGGLCIR